MYVELKREQPFPVAFFCPRARLTDVQTAARFKGELGEQATMFFLDPSGNAIEFKAFEHIENLSAK